jgi:hypothetical protein
MNVDVIHDLWVIYDDGLIYTNWLHHNTPFELQGGYRLMLHNS